MRIRLIHWNAEEAEKRAGCLRAMGHEVGAAPFDPAEFRRLRDDPPDGVVIDLDRIPSHGRDVAMGLRSYRATRHLPIVFVGGAPEKVARIREHLPDAVYTEWDHIRSDLKEALATPPADPVVPASNLAGYSGTPLPKKLGISAGMKVALVGAPPGFVEHLGALPDGVRFLAIRHLRRSPNGRRSRSAV